MLKVCCITLKNGELSCSEMTSILSILAENRFMGGAQMSVEINI